MVFLKHKTVIMILLMVSLFTLASKTNLLLLNTTTIDIPESEPLSQKRITVMEYNGVFKFDNNTFL